MLAIWRLFLLATSTAPGVGAVAIHALAEPARPPDLVPGTVQRAIVCTDAEWDGEDWRCGRIGKQDGNVDLKRISCAGGSHSGTCSCSSNSGKFTVTGGETQTILGRKWIGFSETSSSSPFLATTPTDASSMGQSSMTIAVIPTMPTTPEMLSSSEPGEATRTSTPVLSITPLTLSTSSTSLVSTKDAPSITPNSIPAITSGSSQSTETFATTTLIVPVSSLHPTSPTVTTADSNSINQSPPVIPTMASHPDNTTTTNNLNPTLATKLGLGLGIPLLVLLVVVMTACIHRRQRTLQKQRLNTQAPPFDFDAPEMAPVNAADIAAYRGETVRQYRYGPPRSMLWSEWGSAAGGGGGGGGGGDGGVNSLGSPYGDNQVRYVGPLGIQGGDYQGYQVPWGGHVVDPIGKPYQYQYQYKNQNHQQQEGQDPGGTVGNRSSYDGQEHVLQVPTVRVHQPEQAAQESQRHSVRVSGGLNGGDEEVSPLSSSGSGPPYPRVSAISGMG